MINFFVILFQFLITVLIGRSFYIFIDKRVIKNTYKKIFGLQPYNFYLLFGLFVIGNLTVLVNFFTGSDNIIFQILLLLIAGINIFYLPRIQNINFFIIISSFITYMMILTSTYNAGLSKDSDTYHLNNQLFIKEESIIIGLSNLHHRYGFSSIWEYVLSNFWFDNNLVFLNTPHLILLFSFYFFLITFVYHENLYFKKIAFIIATYGLLDNFGFEGGRNGFIAIDEIGAFDNSFGILFVITAIFLIFSYLNEKVSIFDLFVLGILILFLGQLRYFGFIFFLPYTILLLRHLSNIKDHIYPLSFGILVSISWFLKNVLISSCLIYPIYQTCIQSLSWYQKDQAKVVSLSILGHPRNPNDIFLPLNEFQWITEWTINNSGYLFNFFVSIFIIKILCFNIPNKLFLIGLTISVSFLCVWFFLTPAYRFAPPVFILSLLLLNLDYLKSENNIILKKEIFLIAFVLSCAFLTIRLDSYIAFTEKTFDSYLVTPSTIEYIKRDGYFGVKPLEGKICFLNKNCFPDDYEIIMDDNSFYKEVKPVDKFYWTKFFENLSSKKSI
tara:strand:- start:199 stop:1866 length:1668 start_codon:yes stop_codon:yes gene_type:complete